MALRAAVDLVVHGEVHGPALRRVVDEGFHDRRVRDRRGDVQMADGPARAVPVEPALHPDAVEEVGPFFPQREELVGVERDALGVEAEERVLFRQLHGGGFGGHLLHVVRRTEELGELGVRLVDHGERVFGGLQALFGQHVEAEDGHGLVQSREAAGGILAGKVHEPERIQREGATFDAVLDERALGVVDARGRPRGLAQQAEEGGEAALRCPGQPGEVQGDDAEAADLGGTRPEGVAVAEIRDGRAQTAARGQGGGLPAVDVDEAVFEVVAGDLLEEGFVLNGAPAAVGALPGAETGRHHRKGDGGAGQRLVVGVEEEVLYLLHGFDVRGRAADEVGGHELFEEEAVIHADVGEGGLVAPKLPVQGVDEGGQGLLHVGPDAGGLSDFDVVVIARGQDVVDVAADHDEQVRKPRGPEGGVRRVDRELLHLPQEGVEGFGRVDGQPSAHVQPFQRDVAGGEVEAVRAPDVPHVVDVEGAAEFLLDGLVGIVPPVQLLHGFPQVVQAVQLHEGLGHLIVEGDHVPARHVGVGVDGVVRRGGTLAV